MNFLKDALGRMATQRRWFLYRLTWDGPAGKFAKVPCSIDGARYPLNAGEPSSWHEFASVAEARARLDRQGEATRYAMGYWLTADCGYWFLDLDHALAADGQWQPLAIELCERFPGALIERSSSGQGLHIIGGGTVPPHRTRPTRDTGAVSLEFYHAGRGICFGLDGQAQGCADTQFNMQPLVDAYFAPAALPQLAPSEGVFTGSDDELIQRALAARISAAAAFGAKASFAQLWSGEADRTSEHDMALAAHLAYWTGRDADRVARLMWRSGMVREKWREHRTYVQMTAANACARCANVYAPHAQAALVTEGAANPTTDLANAHRLKHAHGHSMLAVPGVGWHVWNSGGPWVQDDHAAYRLAFDLGRIIQAEADAMTDWVNAQDLPGDEHKRRLEYQKFRAKWAKASESRTVIYNGLDLASKLDGMYASADTLDANAHLVGMPSGVLDLTTCAVRPHAQDDRITKAMACDYSPNATAPTWERFIAEILGGDAALITYVQTLCGYMLTGTRTEHMLPVFHGSGANGKSTMLAILQRILGDYAGTAPPGLLISRNTSDHPTGLASLQGRRLVVVSETSETGRLNEEQVKMLTGGDRITARRMRQDFYSFDPTHIIVLQTNHKPRVTGTDTGIWRRVKLVPFNVTIPPERRDADLLAKLLDESAGILAWMVRGWQMYQRQGFTEPDAVKMATAAYRSDSDHVGSFLEDRCEVRPGLQVQSSLLYGVYKGWCAENGEHPLTQRNLAMRLAERPGIVSGRVMRGRGWDGLCIASHAHLGALPQLGVVG